jgi:hypothetical protein
MGSLFFIKSYPTPNTNGDINLISSMISNMIVGDVSVGISLEQVYHAPISSKLLRSIKDLSLIISIKDGFIINNMLNVRRKFDLIGEIKVYDFILVNI